MGEKEESGVFFKRSRLLCKVVGYFATGRLPQSAAHCQEKQLTVGARGSCCDDDEQESEREEKAQVRGGSHSVVADVLHDHKRLSNTTNIQYSTEMFKLNVCSTEAQCTVNLYPPTPSGAGVEKRGTPRCSDDAPTIM